MAGLSAVLLLLIGVLVGFCAQSSVAGPTCLDANGQAVDWYVAMKVPDYIHSNADDGHQYYFLTPNSQQWTKSRCTVDSQCGPIYNTIQQAYEMTDKNSSVTIMYNDEKPEDDHVLRFRSMYATSTGHMKGVVAFKVGDTGFWVIHSVPKFPGSSSYIYPETGLRYGQHFLCVTFPYSELAPIAAQLSVGRPGVFAYNLPDWLAQQNPDLAAIVNHKPSPTVTNTLMHQLTSSGGAQFTHFSKAVAFNRDLYDSFVAPFLKVSLFMEGWRNGRGDIPSTCDATYKVNNVEEVRLVEDTWKTTHDHSKWAIAETSPHPWVCLGDINRQYSQYHRGGGTMCFNNVFVWKLFRVMVSQFEQCTTNSD